MDTILEGLALKFGRAKNIHSSERFLTTFDVEREYLQNISRRDRRVENRENS